MPRMNSMTKNNTAQRLGNGIRATASGYAMKARPAPLLITSSIGMPIWRARNPIMEKITNPAKIDVARFVNVTIIASLREVKERNIFKTGSRMFAFSLLFLTICRTLHDYYETKIIYYLYVQVVSAGRSNRVWIFRKRRTIKARIKRISVTENGRMIPCFTFVSSRENDVLIQRATPYKAFRKYETYHAIRARRGS